ncbi:MAG: hypothetical protein JWM87_3171, partial [Candidatus Eremiobacteraeota bacterium]|nr:hypothetical protein [Candidatus Eremiobacteraeota bacterium]
TEELGSAHAMRRRAEEALEGATRAYAQLRDDGRRNEQEAQRRAAALQAQQHERDAKIARLGTALGEARERAGALAAERAELEASLAQARAELSAFAAERELADRQDDALTAALLERIAAAHAAAQHDVEEQELLIDGFYRSRAWRLRSRLARVARRRTPVAVRSSKPG